MAGPSPAINRRAPTKIGSSLPLPAVLIILRHSVGRMVLELLGLHALAVEAAGVRMPRLIAVGKHHILLDLLLGRRGHRSRAGALAARGRAEAVLACMCHDQPLP